MIAIGRTAFNENNVEYVWWTNDGRLVIEFGDKRFVIIEKSELANLVWSRLVDKNSVFEKKPGETVYWGSNEQIGLRGDM